MGRLDEFDNARITAEPTLPRRTDCSA